MFVKGIALTALVASTPLALFATQDPNGSGRQPQSPAARSAAEQPERGEARPGHQELERARQQLEAARRDVRLLREQLDAALDRLDSHYRVERDRGCSPSRGRALLSHYRWLRDQGHEPRAGAVLAKVVDQVGDDVRRLNGAASDLMTDKDTAGKFDDVALALTRRMEQTSGGAAKLRYSYLDTVALACFLNGDVEKAVRVQRQAIASGGRSDDFRRRLRTYEAAQLALEQARDASELPAATMVASNDEEDEE